MPRRPSGAEGKGPLTGAYVILFRLEDDARATVGRLGTFDVAAGRYAYVGSAMNGLISRTERHLRGGSKKHWHIDHLLPLASERAALLVPSDVDLECRIARIIGAWDDVSVPIPRFGSSDCRCPAHLFRLDERSVPRIASRLSAELGGRRVLGPSR